MCPLRSISPLRIRVVEIGELFSAGTMFTATISSGASPAFWRFSLIFSAVFWVSLLTTNASKPLPEMVKPNGSFNGTISALPAKPEFFQKSFKFFTSFIVGCGFVGFTHF